MHELSIRQNDGGQRLDKFLKKAVAGLPPALLYKSIRLKKIKVNRKRCTPEQILTEGDTVQLFLPDEFFPADAATDAADIGKALGRVTPKLDIVYEDDNILLLNKRPGISVHEDDGGDIKTTLIYHVQAYLYQRGEYDPGAEQSFAPALCNRIDRNTGGIVIAAKNAAALREMDEQIRARSVSKFYLCAVHGIPTPPRATVKGWLLKDSDRNTVRVWGEQEKHPAAAKSIITRYEVIAAKKDGKASLLQIELLTGRTHQIRAHMAYLGHPLLGDGKYGINRADRARGYKYQALYSYRIRFCFGTEGILGYLAGKEFSIPKKDIYFTGEFINL